MNTKPGEITFAENKKALFDYEVLSTYVGGISLFGSEVKSIRNGSVNLKGSYINIHTGKPQIVGMHISEYKQNTNKQFDPKRERNILLTKREIEDISVKVKESGLTIVPLEVFGRGNLIKLRIGLVRGRKHWQKKQLLKERDLDREVAIKYRY